MRRPLALAAFTALVALTACAPVAEPEATPTPTPISTAERTPTPTPEPLLVGAGEKPPTVFDGDCGAALTPADLRQIVGAELALASSSSDGDVGNVGGLACGWESGETAVRVEILPRAGLGDTRMASDTAKYYFEECDAQWVCSGTAQTADAWFSASFQYFSEATRAEIDEWTTALSQIAFDNLANAGGQSWIRDRTGWWPKPDCAALASAISQDMGVPLEGDTGGYIDPPLPGVLMAAEASRWSNCHLSGGDRSIDVHSSAGKAWVAGDGSKVELVDAGVPGITAWLDPGFQSMTDVAYVLTDGVNLLSATIPTDASWPAEDALRALASAAAADFIAR